jgi:DNA (cytosine-5)-methyltransferase 1
MGGTHKNHSPKVVKGTLPAFYEFFAGGGMARAGLGKGWQCLFANDFDYKKSACYKDNWGDDVMITKDVATVQTSELPGEAKLVWASFPCQDLSLAGMGAGLRGERSGTFWPFWRIIEKLIGEGRGPDLIVLENVLGTLTSHEGKDFAAIAEALTEQGYNYGAVVMDAAEFIPHSRPRLFIIGVASGLTIPEALIASEPNTRHSRALKTAQAKLASKAKARWVWWSIPKAPRRKNKFADLIEENPTSVQWHTQEETKRLLEMMSAVNRDKVKMAQRSGEVHVGAIYKRTRTNEHGEKVQRAEVRFDELAGCLRTPAGGSSRQLILLIKGSSVKSRLISTRETARLMGLPDTYRLPQNYNEAYHLTGDGVAVPVVSHIAANVLEPILRRNHNKSKVAA